MPLGDLSTDQARYAAGLVAATGLDPDVVTAWIGAESGWGVNKPGHNYLNIGPGRTYGSTDQAAGAAAQLLTSNNYAGIRAAIPQGAGAQVAAIQASPWDAGHYSGHVLADVWHQVIGAATGGSGGRFGVDGAVPVNVGPLPVPGLDPINLGPLHLPSLGDIVHGVGAGAAGAVAGAVVPPLVSAALTMVFVAGALALVGLGLARLTGHSAGDITAKVQQVQGQAGQAAALAALA